MVQHISVVKDAFPIARVTILLLLFYAASAWISGPQSAVFCMILASIILYVYFVSKKLGLYQSLVLLIPFLVLFDSPLFAFTAFNLRIWYAIVVVGIIRKVILLLSGRVRFSGKKIVPIVFFVVLSVFHFIIDDQNGRLSNIKYWLFTIGAALILVADLKPVFIKQKRFMLGYILAMIYFVTLFGLVQYAAVKTGLGQRFMLNPSTVRPDAFFSETTWYASYALFGLILLFYYCTHYMKSTGFLLSLTFIAAIFISNTRNAYLAIALVSLFAMLFFAGRLHLPFSKHLAKGYFLLLIVISIVISFVLPLVADTVANLQVKLSLQDASAMGRATGFTKSFQQISASPYLGQGFNWSMEDTIQSAGTAIGAKSFNLFLQIFHIFGLLGLVPFVIIVGRRLSWLGLRTIALNSLEYRYSFYFFLAFLSMSFFAPIHQHSAGVLFLAVSAWLGNEKINETKN